MKNQKVKDCGYHHIALSASDFQKSLEFYTKGLGCSVFRTWETEDGRKIAMLDFGNGTYLELFSNGKQQDFLPEAAGGFFHLALKTTDAADAYERALEAGAKPHKMPAECSLPSEPVLHIKTAFVNGPDNELIEFFEIKE